MIHQTNLSAGEVLSLISPDGELIGTIVLDYAPPIVVLASDMHEGWKMEVKPAIRLDQKGAELPIPEPEFNVTGC